MVDPYEFSARFSLVVLTSYIYDNPSIIRLFFSNSIILLLLVASVWSIYTTQYRRAHHASLATLALAPYLTLFYKSLSLVSPVLVPTLLSNFTFAAVVVASLTWVMLCIAIFLAGFFQGCLVYISCTVFGRFVLTEQVALTKEQLENFVRSKVERWISDYKLMITLYTDWSLVHIPNAMTHTAVHYALLSYYSVLLPPLLNLDSSAKLVPTDILVYGVTVYLGIHASKMLFLLLPGKLHLAGCSARWSLRYVLRSIGDVYWCVIATGLIGVPFAEREVIGGSVSMFWPFVKRVILDGLYELLMSLLVEGKFDDVGGLVKATSMTGVGLMWVKYGLWLWKGVNMIDLKVANRYPMM